MSSLISTSVTLNSCQPSERTVGRLRGNAVSRPPLVLAEEEGAYDSLVENGHEVETLQESDDADIPGMLWSRARFNIATMFVEAARAKMQEMAHGPGQDDHDCSVCYALSGQKVMDHHSGGADCPNEMCYKGDPRWEKFKILLRFPPHRLCYGCLLPTVSLTLCSPPSLKCRVDPLFLSDLRCRNPIIPEQRTTVRVVACSATSSPQPFTRSGSKPQPSCGPASLRTLTLSGRPWSNFRPGAPPSMR